MSLKNLRKRFNIDQLKIADDIPDGSYSIKITKSGTSYSSTLISADINTGDMKKSVYDTDLQETDIFQYAKKAALVYG